MELYLEPERPQRNRVNGKFLKGMTPHNKGKKWSDYIDMRKARKMKKGLLLGRVGNPKINDYCKIPVVGIKDGEFIGIFESSEDAARKLKICGRNIRSCYDGKRNHCGGIQWFKESDYAQWSILLK